MQTHVMVGLVAVMAVASASARTVYDAGKALRRNFTENATPANPYTDENGGKWYYSSAAGVAPYTSLGNFASSYAKIDNSQLQGWGGTSAPHLKVNITGQTLTSSDFMVGNCERIEADEMVFHPGQSGNSCMVLRFVVPAAGWYSAFASFHDISRQTTKDASSGASVYVGVGANDIFASSVVSLEAVVGSTKRFDFQMPVRYLEKNTEIRFSVNNNKGSSGIAHANDATGVKVFVVKEDAGLFYDSGIAMKNNVAALPYVNPYGTIADGTWYCLTATAPKEQTAPGNISRAADSRITNEVTSTSLKGFANSSAGQSPFVLVNTASSKQADVAPGEIKVHPKAADYTCKTWTVLRFRPPESGCYSGSIVVRDVALADLSACPNADGVDVYLYIADTLVTNAYVSLETPVACTAHFTFDRRFMAAGEPVDIVVSPHGQVASDSTGVSAIFRREDGIVYDAGKSFFTDHSAGGKSDLFGDKRGDGAIWQLGAKTNAWCGEQFYTELRTSSIASGSKAKWWMQGRFSSWNEFPYFLMTTNGVASADGAFGISADLFAVSPYEFAARPNDPGYQSSSPTIDATVPSNGIYRVRSCVRDLHNGGGDGIKASVVVNGNVVDTALIQRLSSGGELYESVLSADRLWLKAGDRIAYVIDPLSSKDYDQTGISACYENTGDVAASVVNVDIAGSGAGKALRYSVPGREGWSDWNRWNALRPAGASSASVEDCREADGTTKRNVTVTLTRGSGNANVVGSGSSSVLDNYVQSSGASDPYTFTVSSLKANEPYTLYLYSAKGDASGNATFTVGGETKGVEETWSLGATKMLTRFEAKSDANGVITGTFAAADANGGAFNGLTLVGEFPEYARKGLIVLVR